MFMSERLQKVLANRNVASRRKSELLIIQGRVKVNGVVVHKLGTKVSSKDVILVDNIKVENEEKVYYIMNKPSGIITSVSDEKKRKTVIDFFDEKNKKTRIYPIGRLDYDTSGLLLITNDGELTYKLTHPKFEIEKTYEAKISGNFSNKDIKILKKGFEIDDYFAKARSVLILDRNYKKSEFKVQIVITQGKNHQVKKMFKKVNCEVLKLKRTKYAFLDLKNLSKGNYRQLKIHEVKRLYTISNLNNKWSNLNTSNMV